MKPKQPSRDLQAILILCCLPWAVNPSLAADVICRLPYADSVAPDQPAASAQSDLGATLSAD